MMRCLRTTATAIEIIFCVFLPNGLWAVDISNTPLEATMTGALPALVFILDNSASMDCEFMTSQAHGLFDGQYYLFPDSSYEPANDHVFGKDCALDINQRRMWRSQWSGYNIIYYSPAKMYSPWPSTPNFLFSPSNLHYPLSSPVARDNASARLQMASEFFKVKYAGGVISISNAHYFTHLDVNGNGNQDEAETEIFLVAWEDRDGDGRIDLSGNLQEDCRRYYLFADDGDNTVEDEELIPVSDEAIVSKLRPKILDRYAMFDRYATDAEELQNFVNWFTYHRRRSHVAAALVALYIMQPVERRIGLYALNNHLRLAVRRIFPDEEEHGFNDPAMKGKWELLDGLYAMIPEGMTPLRESLDQVGRYFHTELGSEMGDSPFLDGKVAGACQRAVAVLVTDGFGNGKWTGTGNVDGDSGPPFADPWQDTLADIAMQYYQDDLGPNLPDRVPAAGCDVASHQHMSTHILSLGGQGTLDAGIDVLNAAITRIDGCEPCARPDSMSSEKWPLPVSEVSTEMPPVGVRSQNDLSEVAGDPRIDDLRHAAINGRGGYCSVIAAGEDVAARENFGFDFKASGSAAAVAVSGSYLSTASMIFQTRYDTADWHGDLLAFSFDATGGTVVQRNGRKVWQASELLDPPLSNWNNRRIITYGGNGQRPKGVPFRYHFLSASQMTALGSDLRRQSGADLRASDILDYIRGRRIDGFRQRSHVLGDMVHCTPFPFGDTIFVGANDGMLHAFDAQSGNERFAYVPNLIFRHLKALIEPDYVYKHRFYVDGPCFAGEVLVDRYVRNTYLVGGLGGGGKGYFCLLAGQRQRSAGTGSYGDYHWLFHADHIDSGSSEDSVSKMVQWEYPHPGPLDEGTAGENAETDPDLGFSFSTAYAVNANTADGSFRPVVVFGNGYNSESGKAVLYVLDAQKGTLIRKIDTGIDQDNGLSTPALVDVNLDRRVDYAYAGDLKGNMWKFDLTAEVPGKWGVSYGSDADGDGVIDAASGDAPAPLFHAAGQPITGRPDVMAMSSMCATQAPGYMVVFGTGRYLGASDLGDNHQQSIFGIWDFGDDADDSEYLGDLLDQERGMLSSGLRLEKQAISTGVYSGDGTHRELSTNAIVYNLVEDNQDGDNFSGNNDGADQKANPQSCAGWYLDFPPPPENGTHAGERVTGHVAIRGGRAVIVSHSPNADPCGYGGVSWIYVVQACDGGPPCITAGETVRPKYIQGKLNDNPVVIKDIRQNTRDDILVSEHTGKIFDIGFKGEALGKIYWRQSSR